MTALHLVAAPVTLVHRPTKRKGMQFTTATRHSLEAWLTAELGSDHFKMTDTHLVIITAQGDKDAHLGDWVLKRRTPEGFEFYPVEHEVRLNDYDVEPVTA